MKTIKKLLLPSVITSLASLLLPLNAPAADNNKIHQLYEENCASCHGSDLGGL